MEDVDFTIVPKVLGLVVNPRTGLVAGLVDATGLLTPDAQQVLARSLGKILAEAQLESDREALERLYVQPAHDVDSA
ncbi:MAG: hypothetical protein KGR26_00010 [Cyanobacteria bacterium REEB65]|nr:hypothetical protein [Cyanobacteria bacterium REEB65]